MHKPLCKIKYGIPIAFCAIILLLGCKKYLPQERTTVGSDTQFTIDTYQPVMGRNTYFRNNLFQGSTTYPANFKIINPRRRDGSPAPELTDIFPVTAWKSAYTGLEKSIEEIEAKREIQFHPVLEMAPHSGDITFWNVANSNFVSSLPDSGYLFDVELSNTGGRRYFRNLKLLPYRERAFEPSNLDPLTGQSLRAANYPSFIENIFGATVNRGLFFGDIDVFIRKLIPSAGHSLTFRFLDTLYKPMNPAIFSTTDWPNLLHGFNMQMTDTYVKYDVAFPIPLAALPTKYTSPDGTTARVTFSYSRVGYGGATENARLGLDFAIYEPGDWEIVVAFKRDVPKTAND